MDTSMSLFDQLASDPVHLTPVRKAYIEFVAKWLQKEDDELDYEPEPRAAMMEQMYVAYIHTLRIYSGLERGLRRFERQHVYTGTTPERGVTHATARYTV